MRDGRLRSVMKRVKKRVCILRSVGVVSFECLLFVWIGIGIGIFIRTLDGTL